MTYTWNKSCSLHYNVEGKTVGAGSKPAHSDFIPRFRIDCVAKLRAGLEPAPTRMERNTSRENNQGT